MDDDQQQYMPDTTTRLIERLQQSFSTDYTYYESWPNVWPPSDAWPVVVVQLLTTKPVIGPTQTDEVPETVEITIMRNQADIAGSANVRTTARRHLQNLIQGQDPQTGGYKEGTVLAALRTYLTLTEWLINSDVSIKYDIEPPAELPTMVAAVITLTTWRRVIVSRLP